MANLRKHLTWTSLLLLVAPHTEMMKAIYWWSFHSYQYLAVACNESVWHQWSFFHLIPAETLTRYFFEMHPSTNYEIRRHESCDLRENSIKFWREWDSSFEKILRQSIEKCSAINVASTVKIIERMRHSCCHISTIFHENSTHGVNICCKMFKVAFRIGNDWYINCKAGAWNSRSDLEMIEINKIKFSIRRKLTLNAFHHILTHQVNLAPLFVHCSEK